MSETPEQSLFIGNKSSKELHKAHCAWVRRMSPRNKLPFNAISEAAIAGYDGCGHCLDIYNERLASLGEGQILSLWLSDHPQVRDTILWESAAGVQSYPEWSASRQDDLAEAFAAAWIGDPIFLVDPPPNLANPGDDQHPTTVLSEEHAWSLFVAYVAHCLVVEMKDLVSWSLIDYEVRELLLLFDSRLFFAWNSSYGGYQFNQLDMRGIPAPPQLAFDFLHEKNLVAADSRFETITRLIQWCRLNLAHFSNGFEAKSVEDQWQYRGFPPISRVIAGTPFTGQPYGGIRHRTAGCRGTTSFLRAVLWAVNIPVKPLGRAGHVMPHFVTEDRFLSHGDDPYNQRSKAAEEVAVKHLLIDNETFASWFDSSLPHEVLESNVGRGVDKMLVEHLPKVLLELHCDDMDKGYSHADSQVADYLSHYALEELEALNLWDQIEAKIANLGGCDQL